MRAGPQRIANTEPGMRGSEIANLNFGGPRCAGVYHASPVVGHVNKEGFIAGDLLEFLLFRSCRQILDNDNDNR